MGSTMPDNDRLRELPVPSYHRDLADHLRRTEPELWSWFSKSRDLADIHDNEAEVELLKATYRLEGGTHAALTGHAALLADTLSIDEPISLHQALHDGPRNAQVFRLNGRINVVFEGDLLDLLTDSEQHAVLAHELAHVHLWRVDDEAYFVLDQLLHRLASDPAAADAVVETARRLRLHTEVWADAMAVAAVGDIEPVVTSIVKLNAGIRHVDAGAYLRQAAEILELDGAASQAWTHPELHIRVTCIEARRRGTADAVLDELVNGPDDLDRLDLAGQLRLQALTARVLRSGADAAGDQHAETYLQSYPELRIDAAAPVADGELGDHQPSVRWMAAGLLVDIGLSDGPDDGLQRLRDLSNEATRQGTADEFVKILARATDRTPAEIKQLGGQRS